MRSRHTQTIDDEHISGGAAADTPLAASRGVAQVCSIIFYTASLVAINLDNFRACVCNVNKKLDNE